MIRVNDEVLLGCCGAYCKTCPVFADSHCKGCKVGYADNSRDLSRARCKIKVCCITKNYISCADCSDSDNCELINAFHGKKGYKYKKYREALTFIKKFGYSKFFSIANKWKRQYGQYED
jgi:hypothetical protein